MVRTPLLACVAASTLALGLGGCAHLAKLAANWTRPRVVQVQPRPVQVKLDPVGPNAAEDRLYARAVTDIDRRDYGEALDVLQIAKEARPKDPRVLTALGVVYDKLGRFDLSTRYYDQAEAADPGSRVVAIDRAYSKLLQRGAAMDPAAAPVMLAQAAAPATPSGEQAYAHALKAIDQHEYGVALGELQAARAALPGDARVLAALGVTYDHLGRFDLSERYYAQAQKAAPQWAALQADQRNSERLRQHGGIADSELAGVNGAPPAKTKAKGPVQAAAGNAQGDKG
jgi:Flp pilus assembly protein TadD